MNFQEIDLFRGFCLHGDFSEFSQLLRTISLQLNWNYIEIKVDARKRKWNREKWTMTTLCFLIQLYYGTKEVELWMVVFSFHLLEVFNYFYLAEAVHCTMGRGGMIIRGVERAWSQMWYAKIFLKKLGAFLVRIRIQ